MGLLLFFICVVSVSVVNSQNTHNDTELMLNRTKRYYEAPTTRVNRSKKDSTIPIKSYVIENRAPKNKVPSITPRSMNLRLDNGINTLPRMIVQTKNQPKTIIVPKNNVVPLNTYKLDAVTSEQNIPSHKIIDSHEKDVKEKHERTDSVLASKQVFYEDDKDCDEVNKIDVLKMPMKQKHLTVNTGKPMIHSEADKVKKNKPSHETGNVDISSRYEYNTDMHHVDSDTIENVTCIGNKLNANLPVITNLVKTDINNEIANRNKTTNNLSEHEQQENKNGNMDLHINIEDETQYCIKNLLKSLNNTETEDVTVAIFANVNDEKKPMDDKTEPAANAKPVKVVKSEPIGNIVIKNRTFEEVRERSKTNTPNIYNQDQSKELWSTPQNFYNEEWSPYYYNYDQYQNANYGSNEDIINKSDFTYTKPYRYPYEEYEDTHDNVMDMKPNYYEVTNQKSDYKDLVWRKWKNIVIFIKTAKNNPVNIEIEQKPMNADDKFVNNGLKTPIFYSQGVIGYDDCDKNNDMVAWCSYPSYGYVY